MVFVFAVCLFAALLYLSWVDFKVFRLPDAVTFPLIVVGMLQSWMLMGDWKAAVIGALAGYLIFTTIETGFKKLRGIDGLGRGDAKLLAAGGAWCGWTGLPFIVLIASGSGLVALLFPSFRKRADGGKIPFGPFLALGIFIVWTAFRYSRGMY